MGEVYSKSLLESYIRLADKTLAESYLSFDNLMLRPAASLAYYAMFYSASAALIKAGIRPSKTHQGVVTAFSNYYIKTGKLENKFSRYLGRALNVRQASTYDVTVEPNKTTVADILENAKEFVTAVKKTLGYK